jgi:ribosome-binding factor A
MKSIRFELGTRVRHQLRIIPELKFFVDDSLDYLERIDELLKSWLIPNHESSFFYSPPLSLL